jgi:hypothetical protein
MVHLSLNDECEKLIAPARFKLESHGLRPFEKPIPFDTISESVGCAMLYRNAVP